MKINFVNGTKTTLNGRNAIWSEPNGCYVKGYFEVTRTTEYDYIQMRRMNQRTRMKKKIVIVKQRNKWRMFKTLMHELAHWFIFTFITQDNNKYDKWLDRKKKGEGNEE